MKRWLSCLLCLLTAWSFLGLTSCKKSENAVSRYALTAEYREETNTLAGAVKVEFVNDTDRTLDELKFNLYANAYRKNALYPPVSENYAQTAYYDGKDYGGITITSVNGARSWSIDGVDENVLIARLCEPLEKGEKVTLDLSFVTDLAKINHKLGVTARSVNLANAFPTLCEYKDGNFVENAYSSIGDPFSGGFCDYLVHLTVPSEYVVASSGKATVTKSLETKTKYEITLNKARDFACVLSKDYALEETTVGGTVLKYYYYDDSSARFRLGLIKESFEFFSDKFGEYLYPTYTVAQTGLCYDGAEYPALALLSDALNERELIRSIARETAQQWWYAIVGGDQINESWQDESLAEYSTYLFFDSVAEYGLTKADLVRESLSNYRSYFTVYGSVFGKTDTRMSRPLCEYSSEYEYRCLSRDKGVVLFDALQKSIGDKKFYAGLKNYYKDCKFKMATPDDLIGSFEKTGVSVKGLFDAFLTGKAVV